MLFGVFSHWDFSLGLGTSLIKKLLFGLGSNVTFRLFFKVILFIFCVLPRHRLTVNVTAFLMALFPGVPGLLQSMTLLCAERKMSVGLGRLH